MKICALREISTIVTDSGLEPAMEEAVRETGVELIVVPEDYDRLLRSIIMYYRSLSE